MRLSVGGIAGNDSPDFSFTTWTYWVTVERIAIEIPLGERRAMSFRSGPTAVPFPFSA